MLRSASIDLFQLLVLTAICVLLGTVRWSLLPAPTNEISEPVQGGGSPAFREVSRSEVQEFLKMGNVVLVDVRQAEAFALGHLPGAFNLPRQRGPMSERQRKEVALLGKGKVIVVYCSDPYCNDSKVIAKELVAGGMKRVFVYTGGWEDWREDTQ